jgi:uncharacterized protein involved in outer membrane biogenesis
LIRQSPADAVLFDTYCRRVVRQVKVCPMNHERSLTAMACPDTIVLDLKSASARRRRLCRSYTSDIATRAEKVIECRSQCSCETADRCALRAEQMLGEHSTSVPQGEQAMKIARILGYVVAGISLVLIVAIAGGVVALSFVDFNRYKPWIAEEVKKATGRDLAISGDVHVDFSLRPGIVVDGVTLSNAAWGSRPDMISVRHLSGRIALISLIFGTVEIDRIELDGADILLEVDAQGRANFEFSATGAEPEPPAQTDDTGTGIGELPVVHVAEITEARLTYANAVTGTTFATVVESLTLRGEGPDALLDLEYKGSVNDSPIRVVAKLGDLAGIFNPVAPWPVEITVEGGGATATITGSITQPLAGREVDLAVSVEGARTGDLSKILGTEVPEFGPYELSGLVAGDMTSTVRASGIKGSLGKSDIEGNITVTLTGPRPSIDAGFESNKIDIAALRGAGAGAGDKDQTPPAKKDGRVFSDEPLSLEGLKAVDAAFRYKAASLTGRRGTLSNVAIDATLKDGVLEVRQLGAELYDGAFEGTAQLDGRAEMVGIAANASLRKIDLVPVLAESGAAGTMEGRINLELDARGEGRSIREIMAGLDGKVTLAMGKGRIRSHALQRWVGGPTQILGNGV